MTNAVLDTIAARRSHRAYQDTPVTQAQLDALLAACLQSPSAVNKQPWHISVVRDKQLLSDINDATREGMMRKEAAQRSPRFEDKKFDVFYNAPLVLFLSADPAWRYSMLDCGIAVQNIALAAERMGLGSVILGLPREAFKGERAAEFRRRLCFLQGEDFAIATPIRVPAPSSAAAQPAHRGSRVRISKKISARRMGMPQSM